jgi:predicted nucleic acid-binding protein
MSGANRFLDTNVFAYALDARERAKKAIAADLIVALIRSEQAVVSYQVIQEFLNVAVRASVPGLGPDAGAAYLQEIFSKFEIVAPSLKLCEEALVLHAKYRFHWYDSLIIAAALEAKCEILYTEDLQHGQIIEGLTIINPFL